MPEPIPRPTRLRLLFAFFGARRLERFVAIASSLNAGSGLPMKAAGRLAFVLVLRTTRPQLLDDAHQMRNGLHHAADRRRILTLHDLVQPGEPQALDHLLVLLRRRDLRAVVLDQQCLLRLCHDYSSSTVLPRIRATSALSRSWVSASNVALITLCGLAVPSDLVSTFCTPAEVMTARTVLPAMTPVPSGAGLSMTEPAPKWPSTWCGMVVSVRLILKRFFLAASMPLRMAWGTSLALPEPYPTTPSPGSPITTSAAKDMFLPPLTTLVTRLIETTSSLRLSRFASSFFFIIAICAIPFLAAQQERHET